MVKKEPGPYVPPAENNAYSIIRSGHVILRAKRDIPVGGSITFDLDAFLGACQIAAEHGKLTEDEQE